MMEFKPYEKESTYKCELSKDEALLIQKVRNIGYGQVTAHMVAGKIVRTEEVRSELSKENKDTVTIAFEVLGI